MDTTHTSHSPQQTHELAARLVDRLGPRDVVALSGELGSGKTEFAKGFARALGFHGDVTSPTFTLVHEYSGGCLPLIHIDLYRITSPDEAARFGIEEMFDQPGIALVEWPERARPLFPPRTVWIHIDALADGSRQIHLPLP